MEHPVTVQELIDALSTIEDKTQEVVMSRDSEGNEFRPLAEPDRAICEAIYQPEAAWYGYIRDFDDVEYKKEDERPCVVLWPLN
jgi:hypothetical protein